jgi:magnesium transporter
MIHLGRAREESVAISVIDYDEANITERVLTDVAEASRYAGTKTVSWLNVDGVHDVAVVEKIGRGFDLHPLTMEDVVSTAQRPKLEEYDHYIYIVLRMPHLADGSDSILSEQVSLILTEDAVLSFQEEPGDVFETIRQRLRSGTGRIRREGADYLCYAIVDAIVDHCFVLLERISDRIEAIEEEIYENPSPRTLRAIHELRRESILLRKSIWPLRDVVSGLARTESPLVSDQTRLYLRDVHDHAIQAIDMVETMRDLLGSLIDLYMSAISNRMNEIMKVLTIVGSLFIPMTFIAGVYGMNFEHMPELSWRWGYAGAWAAMIAVLVGMLLFFRRRDWL